MGKKICIEMCDSFFKVSAFDPKASLNNCPRLSIVPVSFSSEEERIEKLRNCVRNLSDEKEDEVVLLFSRSQVTMRTVTLPAKNTDELEEMLKCNLSKLVPFEEKSIYYAYDVAGYDARSYMRVVLSFINRDIAQKYISICESAGYIPDAITLSSYGVWLRLMQSRRIGFSSKVEIYGVLDVDDKDADLVFFSSEGPVYSRSLSFSREMILSEKKSGLAGEMKQSFVLFQNEGWEEAPRKIFITGLSLSRSDVADSLRDSLEIPVEIVDGDEKEAGDINCSCAALSGVSYSASGKYPNFSVPEVNAKKHMRDKTHEFIRLGTRLLAIFFIAVAFFGNTVYFGKHYISFLKKENDKLFADVGEVLERNFISEEIKTVLESRRLPLELLQTLSKTIPSSVSVTFLEFDGEKATLQGEAFQLSDVFELVSLLEDSSQISDIQTNYTRTKQVNDKDVTVFELDFFYNYS